MALDLSCEFDYHVDDGNHCNLLCSSSAHGLLLVALLVLAGLRLEPHSSSNPIQWISTFHFRTPKTRLQSFQF